MGARKSFFHYETSAATGEGINKMFQVFLAVLRLWSKAPFVLVCNSTPTKLDQPLGLARRELSVRADYLSP